MLMQHTIAQSSGTGIPLQTVLVVVIVGVIFFSNIIKSIAKANRKNARGGANPQRPAANANLSLDEIAARRRAQLEQMARQRQAPRTPGSAASAPAGSASSPQAFTGDPAGMSMAERIAKARAAQQQGSPTPTAPPTPSRPRPGQPVPPLSRRDQRAAALRQRAAQREMQRRQAMAARQQQIQQAKAQRAGRTPAPSPRPQTTPTKRTPVEAPPSDPVQRRVRDAAVVSEATPTAAAASKAAGRKQAPLDFARLSKNDLRRAFILKEVLDRPVAERDPLAG